VRVLAGLSAAIATLVGLAVLFVGPIESVWILHGRGPLFDFNIYYDQVRLLRLQPVVLLDRWYYPPFAAWLLWGFGWFSRETAQALWLALQGGLLLALVQSCASVLASLGPILRWVAAGSLTLASLPVIHGLSAGQVSLLIAVLSIRGLAGVGDVRWLAAATAIKIYPVLYATGRLARGQLGFVARLAAWSAALGLVLPFSLMGPEAIALLWQRTYAVVRRSTGALSDDAQTVRAIVGRLFHARSLFDEVPQPLLFGLPEWFVVLLSVVVTVAIVVYSLLRLRGRDPGHPIAIATILVSLSMVVEPGWIHGFAALPYAHAVLLANARHRRVAACLAASFGLSSLPLPVCLLWPQRVDDLYRFGITAAAAALALAGLWLIVGDATAYACNSSGDCSSSSNSTISENVRSVTRSRWASNRSATIERTTSTSKSRHEYTSITKNERSGQVWIAQCEVDSTTTPVTPPSSSNGSTPSFSSCSSTS
jgi:hypothetical protein